MLEQRKAAPIFGNLLLPSQDQTDILKLISENPILYLLLANI